MFTQLIVMLFLACPIYLSTNRKLVERGTGFNKWMLDVSTYTLTIGILVTFLPVILEVMNLPWFQDIKDLLVNDVTLNLREHSSSLTIFCYIIRQAATVINTGAICLAVVQVAWQYYKIDSTVAILVSSFMGLLIIIRVFHMPVDNAEYYKKLFVAIEWAANNFWYFAVGILSFSAGVIMMCIKQNNQCRC